ncbi:MAG: hypothetical protein Q4A74_05665 [Cardiobacteriaceae bacterium]|nr:hypothetical protein [Cardiobacteriaceae bacterium]
MKRWLLTVCLVMALLSWSQNEMFDAEARQALQGIGGSLLSIPSSKQNQSTTTSQNTQVGLYKASAATSEQVRTDVIERLLMLRRATGGMNDNTAEALRASTTDRFACRDLVGIRENGVST